MKTRKCRMTAVQLEMHDKAVRLRKMTDEQLMDYLKAEKQESYDSGYRDGSSEKSGADMGRFLDELAGIKGIGKVTIVKIRKYLKESGEAAAGGITT